MVTNDAAFVSCRKRLVGVFDTPLPYRQENIHVRITKKTSSDSLHAKGPGLFLGAKTFPADRHPSLFVTDKPCAHWQRCVRSLFYSLTKRSH